VERLGVALADFVDDEIGAGHVSFVEDDVHDDRNGRALPDLPVEVRELVEDHDLVSVVAELHRHGLREPFVVLHEEDEAPVFSRGRRLRVRYDVRDVGQGFEGISFIGPEDFPDLVADLRPLAVPRVVHQGFHGGFHRFGGLADPEETERGTLAPDGMGVAAQVLQAFARDLTRLDRLPSGLHRADPLRELLEEFPLDRAQVENG